MTEFETYTSPAERKHCRKMIRAILKAGYTVSVNDGCEWTLKRSTKEKDILGALASTGEDYLAVRDSNGAKIGTISLIWNNGEDTAVSDYSWSTEYPDSESIMSGFCD